MRMTFEGQIIDALRAQPGMRTRELAGQLKCQTDRVSKALYHLGLKGWVRGERLPGERRRLYATEIARVLLIDDNGYLVSDAPTPEPTPTPAPQRGNVPVSPHASRYIAEPKPAPLPCDADADRQRLAGVIFQHLGEGGLRASEDIASALNESRRDVALAISDLLRNGRIVRGLHSSGRWVYGAKSEAPAPPLAHALSQPTAPAPEAPAPAPAPPAEPAPGLSRGVLGALIEAGTAVTERLSALPEPALPAEEPAAQPPMPVSPNGNPAPESFALPPQIAPPPFADLMPASQLPWAIDLEAVAVEDLIGRACDSQVPHAAIKALVVASGALRRAAAALAQRA